MTTLRLGTRGSQLALWQAHYVQGRLQELGAQVEVVVISTKGDRILDRPLALIGGKGLFVKEIEHALHEGDVDLAVHSLKDMPVDQPPGLMLSAFPVSASPFDAMCGREPMNSLAELREGARIGTGSLRRGAQLKALRPDLEIVGIRGNVETRLSRRFSPEPGLDAVVLAEAGLRRLGLWEPGFFALCPPDMLPAPAQGVLAIEVRESDATTRALVDRLDDVGARLRVTAERSCLAGIEGNCHTPFAVFAHTVGGEYVLHGRLFDDAGNATEDVVGVPQAEATLDVVTELGQTLAASLLGGLGPA
ncbi:MAG: hydroxymethylbilane synthase [Bradymonadia bacterium]|jgi:hydroxymethylbilane synthase